MSQEKAQPAAATPTFQPSKKRKRSAASAEKDEQKQKAARMQRGPGVELKKLKDKKLKGKLRHAESVGA